MRMKWYLITKVIDGKAEYRLGRLTKTAATNNERHGWTVIAKWDMKPSEGRSQEAMFIYERSQEQ
jgi:hypothetical protein